MKKKNLIVSVMISCLTAGFLLPGCNGQRQIDSETVKTVKVTEDVHLVDDPASPACKITIDYGYLAEESAADTTARRINRAIAANTLGEEYAALAPAAAVDSFKNHYITVYRGQISEMYEEDVKKGVPRDELPSWYNYEYSLNVTFDDGKEGILNVIAETDEYTGGAHPNAWSRWMNFEKNTGRLLTLNDVFMAGSEKPLCEMLQKALIAEMADRTGDKNIQSLEDLHEEGILLTTDIYVPENFLLKKDKVLFLYNKYDIAPYATGTIDLSLPYAEVEKYMIH